MQYSLVGTEDGSNITVFVTGKDPFVAHSSHPNFQKILEGVMAKDEAVVDLFDLAQTAATEFKKLSDRVSVANNRLYLDGDEVNDVLSSQVIRFLNEGVENWKPLVAFFENVQANPSAHSREQLYNWLNSYQFTITDNGQIVGYKGVRGNPTDTEWLSIKSGEATVDGVVAKGQIPNKVGSVIEMPRSEVVQDSFVGCSVGLHVGTYNYAKRFSQGTVLEVHVNPRDVVSVPTDCDEQKMRVCRYLVVKSIEAPYTASVVSDYADDFWDEDEDNCDENDYDNVCEHEPAGSSAESQKPDAPGRTVTIDIDQVAMDYTKKKHPLTTKEVIKKAAAAMLDEVKKTRPIKNGTFKAGDVYQDLDKRRMGRTVTIQKVDGDKAVVRSLPSNVTVKVSVDRLLDPTRFRKV